MTGSRPSGADFSLAVRRRECLWWLSGRGRAAAAARRAQCGGAHAVSHRASSRRWAFPFSWTRCVLSEPTGGRGRRVINQTMAEHEWPGQDPIGKRLSMGGGPMSAESWFTVVGIVADFEAHDLQSAMQPGIYFADTILRCRSCRSSCAPRRARRPCGRRGSAAVARSIRSSPLTKCGPWTACCSTRLDNRGFGRLLTPRSLRRRSPRSRRSVWPHQLYRCAACAGDRRPARARRHPSQIARLIVGQGLRLSIAGVIIGVAGALSVARLLQGLLSRSAPPNLWCMHRWH